MSQIPDLQDELERRERQSNIGQIESSNIWPPTGYKTVPKESLPSRGGFYPEDVKIAIRPLTVKEVRHFSTIDETDQIDIITKLNYVLESCILIDSLPKMQYSSILEFDRIYLILAIRDITFINSENKLVLSSTCNSCSNVDTFEINKDRIRFTKPSSWDEILQTYTEATKSFNIKLSNTSISIFLPSIYNVNWVRDLIKNHIESGNSVSTLDMPFLYILPYLVSPLDKLNDSMYSRVYSLFDTLSVDDYAIVDNAKRLIENNIQSTIRYKCSGCGNEVVAPLRFQGGIRGIFIPVISNFVRGILQS